MTLSKRPVDTKDNELTVTYVVRRYNLGAKSTYFSPYRTFAGYQWRLLVRPLGKASEVEATIECGGPCITPATATATGTTASRKGSTATASAPSSSRRSTLEATANGASKATGGPSRRSGVGEGGTTAVSDKMDEWRCHVRYRISVVHPLRWAELGLTLDIAPHQRVDKASDSNEEQYIPSDVEVTNCCVFSADGCVVDEEELVPIALLQPGMYANANYDFVIRFTLFVNDSWMPCHAQAPTVIPAPRALQIAHKPPPGGDEESKQSKMSTSFLRMFGTVTRTYRQTSMRRTAR